MNEERLKPLLEKLDDLTNFVGALIALQLCDLEKKHKLSKRKLINLLRFSGLKSSDIAHILGKSESYVRSALAKEAK